MPSCGRMIRLLAHPLPHSLPREQVGKLSHFLSLPVCRLPTLLTGEGWARSRILRPQESLGVYIIQYSLYWLNLSFVHHWYVALGWLITALNNNNLHKLELPYITYRRKTTLDLQYAVYILTEHYYYFCL